MTEITEGQMKNLAWQHASVVISKKKSDWGKWEPKETLCINQIELHSIIRAAFVAGYECAKNPPKLIEIKGSSE